MVTHIDRTTEVILIDNDEPCLPPGSLVRRVTTLGPARLIKDHRGTDIVVHCDHALADRSDPHMVAVRSFAEST